MAAGLGSCGDGSGASDSDGGTPSVAPASDPTSPAQNGPETAAASPDRQKYPVDPGGSSYEGGEKNVEEFGDEASGAAEEAVLAAEQGYLTAQADSDFTGACSFASRSLLASLDQLVPPEAGERSCPEILRKLLSSRGSKVAQEQLAGKVVRVRVEGRRAFVVFHAPGARLFAFPMTREGDEWKVATLTSSILAPSAETLGGE